jgi:sugar porter (SP) family MFS transporter
MLSLACIAPLYISEIAPPEIRGSLLVLQEFSIVFGIVIAFWITYGTRFMAGEWSWRLPFLLQMVPGLILGVGIIFLPFSPRWLSSQGRDDEALVVLSKLRSLPTTDPRIYQEWCEIRAEVAFTREVNRERHPDLQSSTRTNRIKLELASWTDCFRHGCWRRTVVGVGIMFFQQFVGINALIYYAPSLFATLGQGYEMRLLLSGIINVTQLVGVATSLWTMDRFGRRPLLLSGAALMFGCHLIIAVLVGKCGGRWESYVTEGWVAVAFLFFYMFSFGATWGPVPWAIPSEIFPSSLRAKGVALSTCSNWLNNFIIVRLATPFSLLHPLQHRVIANATARVSSHLPLCRTRDMVPTRSLQCFVCSPSSSLSSAYLRLRAKHSSRWTRCFMMSAAMPKSRRKQESCRTLLRGKGIVWLPPPLEC